MSKLFSWKRTAGAIFILIFLVMLVLNFLTPLVSDDFVFSFRSDGGGRISSLSDIIWGLSEHWVHANGRIIPHFFVYIFLMMPKAIFNVINAGACTLCVWLFYSFYRSKDDLKNLILLICGICMLWCFIPAFGENVLWLTGACNYLWGMVIYLALLRQLYPIFTGKTGFLTEYRSYTKKAAYIVLAFIAGFYSENGGSSTIFIFVCLFIVGKIFRRKISVTFYLSFIALCAGFLLVATAPAVKNGRLNGLSFSDIADSVQECILMLKQYASIPLCIYAGVLALSLANHVEWSEILFSLVLVLGGVISVAVFAVALYLPLRSFHIIIVYTSLATLLLFSALWKTGEIRFASILTGIMAIVFAFSFVLGVGDNCALYLQYRARVYTIHEALEYGEDSAWIDPYLSSTSYTAVAVEQLDSSAGNWYNDLVAKYYGLNYIWGESLS